MPKTTWPVRSRRPARNLYAPSKPPDGNAAARPTTHKSGNLQTSNRGEGVVYDASSTLYTSSRMHDAPRANRRLYSRCPIARSAIRTPPTAISWNGHMFMSRAAACRSMRTRIATAAVPRGATISRTMAAIDSGRSATANPSPDKPATSSSAHCHRGGDSDWCRRPTSAVNPSITKARLDATTADTARSFIGSSTVPGCLYIAYTSLDSQVREARSGRGVPPRCAARHESAVDVGRELEGAERQPSPAPRVLPHVAGD